MTSSGESTPVPGEPVAGGQAATDAVRRPAPAARPVRPEPARGARRQRVAVIIPAKDESRRIAATVRAARAIPGVDLVLVVDDGS